MSQFLGLRPRPCAPVLRKYSIPLGLAVTTGSGRSPWHHERMVNLLKIASLLVEDAFRWLLLLFRSAEALRAENLFLRRQLALYIERGVRPEPGCSRARWPRTCRPTSREGARTRPSTTGRPGNAAL